LITKHLSRSGFLLRALREWILSRCTWLEVNGLAIQDTNLSNSPGAESKKAAIWLNLFLSIVLPLNLQAQNSEALRRLL